MKYTYKANGYLKMYLKHGGQNHTIASNKVQPSSHILNSTHQKHTFSLPLSLSLTLSFFGYWLPEGDKGRNHKYLKSIFLPSLWSL